MIIVGITGGIGSGKSVVCNMLRIFGVPVYDADSEARKHYERHPELIEKVRKEISPDVFDKSGKIDRRKLAELIFTDTDKLEKLNKLVHPLVRKDFEEWVKTKNGSAYVVKEAAILFESGAHKDCDKIITIISPNEIRIQRVRDRDRKTKQEVEEIIANQWDDEKKISKSDYTILNDEKEMVLPQVIAIHEELVRMGVVLGV